MPAGGGKPLASPPPNGMVIVVVPVITPVCPRLPCCPGCASTPAETDEAVWAAGASHWPSSPA